jgi:hypothetical protein
VAYNHQCYIPRLLRRLTKEYKLRSSVIELYSSVMSWFFVVIMQFATTQEPPYMFTKLPQQEKY